MKTIVNFLLLLLMQTSALHAIKPVVPADVLSPEEIESIMSERNFFFRDKLATEQPLWDHLVRQYGSHFLKSRVQEYSLNDVVHKALSDGFPVQYKIQELYRSGLNLHITAGRLAPRLALTLGEGLNPININNLFTNLFGFLLPSHWFEMIQAERAYDATKFIFLKSMLDQYYNAELIYLDLHQLIQEFEIKNFYLMHLQLLAEYLESQGRDNSAVVSTYGVLGTEMATNRGAIKLKFDDLADVMVLNTDQDGNYAADILNIANVESFPTEVKQLEKMLGVYGSKEKFIVKILERSVEIKAVLELQEVARLNIGITATGGILEAKDSPTDNYVRFGVSFGYDTLPRILSAESSAHTAEIDVASQTFQMIQSARRAFDGSTNAIGGYTEAHRSMELNRAILKDVLERVIDDEAETDSDLLARVVLNVIQSELMRNNALHNMLRAHALMRRLLVVEEKNILNYLPDNNETHKIQRFFLANYSEYSKDGSHMNESLRRMYKARKLKEFLGGYYVNLDKGQDEFNENDVKEVVSDNIGALLKKRSMKRPVRRPRFYRVLNDYVEENKIFLSDHDQGKLMKHLRE